MSPSTNPILSPPLTSLLHPPSTLLPSSSSSTSRQQTVQSRPSRELLCALVMQFYFLCEFYPHYFPKKNDLLLRVEILKFNYCLHDITSVKISKTKRRIPAYQTLLPKPKHVLLQSQSIFWF